jgi:hypothetical protein
MFWFVMVWLRFFNEVLNSVFMFPQRRMLGWLIISNMTVRMWREAVVG